MCNTAQLAPVKRRALTNEMNLFHKFLFYDQSLSFSFMEPILVGTIPLGIACSRRIPVAQHGCEPGRGWASVWISMRMWHFREERDRHFEIYLRPSTSRRTGGAGWEPHSSGHRRMTGHIPLQTHGGFSWKCNEVPRRVVDRFLRRISRFMSGPRQLCLR